MHKALRGFTLIEMAVVLAIIGLLTGGVLVGQSLIRSSELHAVSNEFQRYTTAIHTFRDKYFASPGDMNNATTYWAAESNGDGNGQIMGSAPTVAATNETAHFWTQLSTAGLIEGTYTPGSWAALTDVSQPKSRLSAARWGMRYVGVVGVDDTVIGSTGAATQIMYEGNYSNAFFLMSGSTLAAPSGGVLVPIDAWNIDLKMDDGKPATGIMTTLESQGSATPGSGCGNTAKSVTSQAAAAYDVAAKAQTCSLVFKTN